MQERHMEKAFEQLSAVVTCLGSIYSGHGGLWSVSMALTQKEPGICCCLALTSEWSRDILPPSASTQEEFEVSALWKTHTVKLISGAALRAMDTSGFSHLSLKAVCEGLFALYPHLQRASWDSRSSMRKCYHLCCSLLILHSCNCFRSPSSSPSQTIQFVLFIWPPLEASIIYSTIRPPTDPRRQFLNMPKPLN